MASNSLVDWFNPLPLELQSNPMHLLMIVRQKYLTSTQMSKTNDIRYDDDDGDDVNDDRMFSSRTVRWVFPNLDFWAFSSFKQTSAPDVVVAVAVVAVAVVAVAVVAVAVVAVAVVVTKYLLSSCRHGYLGHLTSRILTNRVLKFFCTQVTKKK